MSIYILKPAEYSCFKSTHWFQGLQVSTFDSNLTKVTRMHWRSEPDPSALWRIYAFHWHQGNPGSLAESLGIASGCITWEWSLFQLPQGHHVEGIVMQFCHSWRDFKVQQLCVVTQSLGAPWIHRDVLVHRAPPWWRQGMQGTANTILRALGEWGVVCAIGTAEIKENPERKDLLKGGWIVEG